MKIPAGIGYSTILPTMDFEVYSEAGFIFDGKKWKGITKNKKGLDAVGSAVYSEHPSTFVRSLAYDLLDGAGDRLWIPGAPDPIDLFNFVQAGGIIEAHHSLFEYYIWKNVCNARMNWPELPLDQLRCSMGKCRAHSLPGKLEKVAEILDADEKKDTRGQYLIRKLCIPQTPTKKNPEKICSDPDLLSELYQYNIQDVKAEASVSAKCPDLSPYELDVWLLDQKINARGVYIDQVALSDCIAVVNSAFSRYTEELRDLTYGVVKEPTEVSKIQGWLGANGVNMRSLDADAVKSALKRDDIPNDCRRVLEIRSSLGAASIKKLFAIDRQVSADGRLRNLFAYCGADRTGRWAGRGPQPQNLTNSGPGVIRCKSCGGVHWNGLLFCRFCGSLRYPDSGTDWNIDAVGIALADISTRNLDHIERMWGDAVAVVSGCLRGLFSAAPKCELLCSDYSAIEAVNLAELAGEEWRQEVFRTHGKIYEMSASKICSIPFEDFMAHKERTGQHHPMRKKVGKVAELASGYGGGYGAWVVFGADKFMTEDEIRKNIKAWRAASPAISDRDNGIWYGLQKAAFMAVQNPDRCYSFQAPATRFNQPPAITYGVKDNILYCRLPSGRNLTYHAPRLEQYVDSWGRPDLRLTYMGWNSDYTKGPIGWTRLETWGGKLTENVDQAVSRDLLAHALLNLERAGYPIVLHVHDETVSEVPVGYGTIEEYEKIMSTVPSWAEGWPVRAAGGWRGMRYRKD